MQQAMTKGVILDYGSLAADDLDVSDLMTTQVDWVVHDYTDESDTASRIANQQIILTNKVQITAEHFAANPQLKLVIILATGTNNVDLDAAKAYSVQVSHIVDYSTTSVVQHTLAVILAHFSKLLPYHHAVQRGDWHKSHFFGMLDYPIEEVEGKSIGIIGYGKIGRKVAQLVECLGMDVCICESLTGTSDPSRTPLNELLQCCDVVSIHCPLSPESSNLIQAEQLSLMKPDSLLINVGRGGIIDEKALALALEAQEIGGAAIDVLAVEPPKADSPLLSIKTDRLLVTPHTAWGSRQARQKLVDQTAMIIKGFFDGKVINSVSI